MARLALSTGSAIGPISRVPKRSKYQASRGIPDPSIGVEDFPWIGFGETADDLNGQTSPEGVGPQSAPRSPPKPDRLQALQDALNAAKAALDEALVPLRLEGEAVNVRPPRSDRSRRYWTGTRPRSSNWPELGSGSLRLLHDRLAQVLDPLAAYQEAREGLREKARAMAAAGAPPATILAQTSRHIGLPWERGVLLDPAGGTKNPAHEALWIAAFVVDFLLKDMAILPLSSLKADPERAYMTFAILHAWGLRSAGQDAGALVLREHEWIRCGRDDLVAKGRELLKARACLPRSTQTLPANVQAIGLAAREVPTQSDGPVGVIVALCTRRIGQGRYFWLGVGDLAAASTGSGMIESMIDAGVQPRGVRHVAHGPAPCFVHISKLLPNANMVVGSAEAGDEATAANRLQRDAEDCLHRVAALAEQEPHRCYSDIGRVGAVAAMVAAAVASPDA